MHIKSFNVDNSAVILGGRNLENSYFGADKTHVFVDNDILGIGPISSQLTYEFETYWQSENVYSLKEIGVTDKHDSLDYLRQKAAEFAKTYATNEYISLVAKTDFSTAFRAKALDLTFAEGTIYYDDATKVSTDAYDQSTHLIEQLKPYILNTTKSLRIINPYFVPTKKLMAFFKELREKGVEIYILTNSLPSADAPFVYAFYKQYQKPLLEMGVHLYEVKSKGFKKSSYSRKFREVTGDYLSVQLHAKTMLIDD
jgi:putative cardiolipin synthase